MDDCVTVLVKDPSRDWDDPVEVFQSREDAEEAREELGARLDPDSVVEPIGRLVDAPYRSG